MAVTPYLIERAKREGNPLIDGRLARDGASFDSAGRECHVTFVWQGKNPPALTGDFVHWSDGKTPSNNPPLVLDRVEPNVWARTLTFPRDAYVEYVFLQTKNSQGKNLKQRKRVIDPFNAHKVSNGFGGSNNYFYAPRAKPTPFLSRAQDIPRGRVTTHTLRVGPMIYGYERKVHLYQPPTDNPAALLVVLDGQDYLRRVKLPLVVDNLFAHNKIPPLAVAMVENTNASKGSARMSEYACNELTLIFLSQFVVALAQEKLRLIDLRKRPRAYGIMGASIGGLMALYTALRVPETFGTVICQAGSFEMWGNPTPPIWLAPQMPVKPRVWLDVGRMDWLWKLNRRMRNLLQQSGYKLHYREYNAYHNWTAWRNVLPEALIWAFGDA